MPSAIEMSPVMAVTSILPVSVVVRSPLALCVTPVPPVKVKSPVIELTAALTVSSPATLTVTSPLPCAETTLLIVRPLASTSMLICPLPASVRTPVPPMISPSVSCTKMFPLVLLVATSVPIVVSMSDAPPVEPIPVAADITKSAAVTLAVSPARMSVIAPDDVIVTVSPTAVTLPNPMLPLEVVVRVKFCPAPPAVTVVTLRSPAALVIRIAPLVFVFAVVTLRVWPPV